MEVLFSVILKMSITGGIVALLVIFARIFLKKAPKIFSYAMWAVVLFRLVSPISFESTVSLFSLAPQSSIIESRLPLPEIQPSPIITAQTAIASEPTGAPPQVAKPPAKPPSIMFVLSVVWLFGGAVVLLYSVRSYRKLRRSLKEVTHIEGNIYEVGELKTPFVFGILRPKIYLPVGLCAEERSYILAHEQVHIARRDYLVKPLAFLALCVHWFNPLVWISFALMSRDMEMSCDERVLRERGAAIKRAYSTSLLSLSTSEHLPKSALAFGEGSVKERIKNVLNYKKPAFWVSVAAIIAVIVIGIVLVANPQRKLSANPDLSNITAMGYGTQMPLVLYANDDYTVISDTFGAIVYDFNKKKITDRISYEQGRKWGISMPSFSVSEDGKTIFTALDLHISSSVGFYYAYSIADNSYKKVKGEWPAKTAEIGLRMSDDDAAFLESTFDNFKEIGKIGSEGFVYLRNKTPFPGKYGELQLVKCNYAAKTSEVFELFGELFSYKKDEIPKKLTNYALSGSTAYLGSGANVGIDIVMTEGEYYDEAYAGSGGGTYAENYAGKYEIRVFDGAGELLSKTKLTDEAGKDSFNFSGQFPLYIYDYNGDGSPDFSIGQWLSSGANVHILYTIDDSGKARKIGNIDTSEGKRSEDFSVQFKNSDPTTIKTSIYNNAIGAAEDVYYRYDEEKGEFIRLDEPTVEKDYGSGVENVRITTEDGKISCEMGSDKDKELDSLEMLGEIEKLKGFRFDTAWAEHGYVKLDFTDKKPESVFLRYCENEDDIWQQEYPIDSGTYRIKVPPKMGAYGFFADIKWDKEHTETIFFGITVSDSVEVAPQNSIKIVTDEATAVACEYGREWISKYTIIDALGEIDEMDGFTFDRAWAKNGYIKVVFEGKKPTKISLQVIGQGNGITQSDYAIDADYRIKVPDTAGTYRFLAKLSWAEGESEMLYFSVNVA